MSPFLTEGEMAELMRVDKKVVVEWRRRYSWPHMKVGRQIRFTEADVRAIAARHHIQGHLVDTSLSDQTALSAARAS